MQYLFFYLGKLLELEIRKHKDISRKNASSSRISIRIWNVNRKVSQIEVLDLAR
jgi:hypothetical protein